MSDTFGGRLRNVRKKFGLTQKEFGEKLGVSLPTVNRLEQSDGWPHEDFLLKLQAEFNCDPTWILTGQGDKGGSTGKVNSSDVKHVQNVRNYLEAQHKEWSEILTCSEQIVFLAPEIERREAEDRIRIYREKINYIKALLEVGCSADSEGNSTP